MAIPLTINGATFEYPQDFDETWGVNATGWAQAVTNGMLQMAGGNFPLTADVNFGPNFGIVSLYYKSHLTNIATAGIVRLSVSDTIDWRNNANSANNSLSINGSDQLLYNGVVIGAAAGVTSITGTANQIIASASTGAITLSAPQDINSTASPTFNTVTANLVGNVTGTVTGHSTLDLALTGGTMSGAIAMGANKITGLTNGSSAQDAVAFTQLSAGNAITAGGITNATITTTQVASNTIAGSTANSSGSAGNVQQGTISTPDFRANAVTNSQTSGATGSGFTPNTNITSVSITTIGGPVLIIASASLDATSGTILGQIQLSGAIAVQRGSTGITGATTAGVWRGFSGSGANQIVPLNIVAIDTPTAGTYTYNLVYDNGTSATGCRFYDLSVVELRA